MQVLSAQYIQENVYKKKKRLQIFCIVILFVKFLCVVFVFTLSNTHHVKIILLHYFNLEKLQNRFYDLLYDKIIKKENAA